MLNKALADKLNEQINLEFFSSNMYLQMSAWCQVQGLGGAAFFLRKHSGEELEHMHKIFGYLNDLGSMALVGRIDAPPVDYASIGDVFQRALEHEKQVTAKINQLVDLALTQKDYATFNFLQWYVAEQREEETLFADIVAKIEMLGGENRGLFFVDREIAAIGSRQ
jgi:ferritin